MHTLDLVAERMTVELARLGWVSWLCHSAVFCLCKCGSATYTSLLLRCLICKAENNQTDLVGLLWDDVGVWHHACPLWCWDPISVPFGPTEHVCNHRWLIGVRAYLRLCDTGMLTACGGSGCLIGTRRDYQSLTWPWHILCWILDMGHQSFYTS